MSSLSSKQPAHSAARAGFAGTLVGAFAFFDGVFLGAPIALLAASFRPLVVYGAAVVAVVLIVTACCRWVDRRWDVFFSGNGSRVEKRLETMRASRLMRHPVEWIERGSDRWYGLAAAVALKRAGYLSIVTEVGSSQGLLVRCETGDRERLRHVLDDVVSTHATPARTLYHAVFEDER